MFGPSFQQDHPIRRQVTFYQRGDNRHDWKIDSWFISKSIEEFVSVSNIQHDILDITFDSSTYKGVWTNCTITGYVEVTLSTQSTTLRPKVNIPAVLILKQQKIRD